VRRWTRIATGGVAIVAGAALVVVAEAIEALAEEGESSAPGVGLGIAAIVVGAATFAWSWARYLALAILATVFWLAFSGELADDVVYEAIAGVGFVLLGLLSLIGHRSARGTRGAPPATAEAPAPPARSGGPSTPGAEPDGPAPRL
jgi:hypothetical protein